jgi:hypothetical protein
MDGWLDGWGLEDGWKEAGKVHELVYKTVMVGGASGTTECFLCEEIGKEKISE